MTLPTVIELIEAGAKQLTAAGVAYGHGTSNAFDEAAWLVLWQLGLPLDELDAVADRPVRPRSPPCCKNASARASLRPT